MIMNRLRNANYTKKANLSKANYAKESDERVTIHHAITLSFVLSIGLT